MYSIEEFQQGLVQGLETFLKDKYGDAYVNIEHAIKTNRELTGLRCVVLGDEQHCSPIIYLEDIYKRYSAYEDYELILDEVKNQVVDAIEEARAFGDEIRNFYRDHSNVFFHFIHTEQNKELLKTLPHREFHDLSIIYRCHVFQDEYGRASAQIDNRLAEVMGLDEEELYKLAYENTRRLFLTSIKPINEVIEELQLGKGNKVIQDFKEAADQEEPLFYVVSNGMRDRGAINILYTDELQKLAEQLDCDLYLLPSSVHEMLAVPEHVIDLNSLTDMVHEVNQMVVEVEDRLSNEVYKYDRKEQSIVQVTDAKHKMLVEEPGENMEMNMNQMRKENIIFSLVNTERYHDKLEEIPHRLFEDLTIVYYEMHPEEDYYSLVSYEDLENANITEVELHELAFDNTRRIMVPQVRSISEMVQELAEEMDMTVTNDKMEQVPAYVITNEQRRNGAVNILYRDVMDDVAKKLGGDLWLIPCSTNEFIATKVRKDLSIDDLQELVHFMNMISYPSKTRLSNQMYEYDSTRKQIKQATFSPYTRLDEGRPQWSEWLLNGQELPRTDCKAMDENPDGMQMGM